MRASISLLTPEKMITANVDSIPPGWNASKYVDFKTRKGKYKLNDKATEKKLKKAANFHDIKVDDMKTDSSHSIQFSTGSYLTTVVPLLDTFKGLVGTEVVSEGKDGEEIKINVDKVEDKTDVANTQVEHIIRLRVGGEDAVVTMYDTTLRMRIQGMEEQVKYTTQVLIPYLEDQVSKNAKASKEFNEMMIAYNFASQTPQAAASSPLKVDVLIHQQPDLVPSNETELVSEIQAASTTITLSTPAQRLEFQAQPSITASPTPVAELANQVDGPSGLSLVTSSPTSPIAESQPEEASRGLEAPDLELSSTPASPATPAQPVVRQPGAPLPHNDTMPPGWIQMGGGSLPVSLLSALLKGADDAEQELNKDNVEDDEVTDLFENETNKVKVIDVESEIELIEQDFVCVLCDRSFVCKEELSSHEKQHGELTLENLMRKILALEEEVKTLSKTACTHTCPPAANRLPIPPSPLRPTFASVTASNPQPVPNKAKQFKPAPRPKGKIDIQLFADSISTNIVGPAIEKATGSLLRTTKAYAAQADDVAKFQNKVVSKVVRRHQKPVHTAIIGAASVDITNQQTTGGTQEENVVTTVASSHSIIESAEFLIKSGKAKQVIVLEHTPRYDDAAKANLSILANKTLHTARNESEVAENIFVGCHTGLDVSGEERTKRFTNDGTNSHSKHVRLGANDQLHMYSQAGAQAITRSLLNILNQAGIVKEKPQLNHQSNTSPSVNPSDWQRPQTKRGFQSQRRGQINPHYNSDFEIPTFNRFQGFW